ncbi:MAG: hypothetical protein P8L80_03040 [Flavobacteriales bacterium]|jgi:hypothetical protein|nr:hypothetical protein [Flavobacteriales bacterium]MBT7653324.1 hypothetical protein [Flavobacteriales bacterium]MDG2363061.1 hypothetical protein [Flavobacteriales bacterium]
MEENKINSALTGLRLVIIALGVLLVAIIIGKSNGDESFVEGEASYGVYLDWMFYIIYTVGIACSVAAVGFGIYAFVMKLVNDFKSQLGTLAGGSVFAMIGLASYFILADGTVLNAYEASGITVTESESIFAGGSMIYVYLLFVVAAASIIWAEVSSTFK